MENKPDTNIEETVDVHRWLMNNGMFNDAIKNNLFMYGSVCHARVRSLDLEVEVEQKTIKYKLFFDKSDLKLIYRFQNLSKNRSFLGLFFFKRLIKKHGNLDVNKILSRFIKDYCGPKWKTEVELLDYSNYVDEYEKDDTATDFGQNQITN